MRYYFDKLVESINNNLVYYILYLAFLLRSFAVYVTFDSRVYMLWTRYFTELGSLPYPDHPPLMFMLTSLMSEYIIPFLKSSIFMILLTHILLSVFLLYLFRKKNIHLRVLSTLLIVHFGLSLVYSGTHEILTSVVMLFGLFSIYLTYKLGSDFFNERTGIIASLLLALVPWHIIYSKTLLIDMLSTTFILWSVYIWLKFIEKDQFNIKSVLLTSFILILALYSKYYALIILPILLVVLMVKRGISLESLMYTAPLIISSLFFVPWLIYTDFYLLGHYAFSSFTFYVLPNLLAPFNFLIQTLTLPIFLIFVSSIVYFLFINENDHIDYALLLMFFVPFVIYNILTYFGNIVHTFTNISNYMLFSLPFIALIVASFLENIHEYIEISMKSILFIVFSLTLIAIMCSGVLSSPEFEYDEDYLNSYANFEFLDYEQINYLEDFEIPEWWRIVYSFDTFSHFDDQVDEKTHHERWISPNKMNIFSHEEQEIDFGIYVVPLSDAGFEVVNHNDDIVYISEENISSSKVFEFDLELDKGVNHLKFIPLSDECVAEINDWCINYFIA